MTMLSTCYQHAHHARFLSAMFVRLYSGTPGYLFPPPVCQLTSHLIVLQWEILLRATAGTSSYRRASIRLFERRLPGGCLELYTTRLSLKRWPHAKHTFKIAYFFASTGRCPYKDLRIRQLEPCCLRSGQYCPRPMEQDSHCTRARVPYCLERPCFVVFGRISTRCEWSWLSCVTLQRYHAATQGRFPQTVVFEQQVFAGRDRIMYDLH